MNTRLAMIFFLGISIIGCRSYKNSKMTEDEFRKKYATEEAIITTKDFYNNLWHMEFWHNNKKHIINASMPTQSYTDKFVILFDTISPEKNYLILWHKKINPKGVKTEKLKGKISHLKQYKNNVVIEYNLIESGRKNYKRKRTEFFSLLDYQKLSEIYNNGGEIDVLLCYMPSNNSENKVCLRPFAILE